MLRPPPRPTRFPYTTLFRSEISWFTTPGSTTARRSTGSTERMRSIREHSTTTPPPSAIAPPERPVPARSEEHTSELQSLRHLVCRLLLEKKKHQQSRQRAPT